MASAAMTRFKSNLSMSKVGPSLLGLGTATGVGFLYGYKTAKGEKIPAVGSVDAVVIGGAVARVGAMFIDPSYGDYLAAAADGALHVGMSMMAVRWGTDYAKKPK